MSTPKKQTLRREGLADLYNQLQALMPVLEEIVQPVEVREATQPYTPSPILADLTGPRYRFEKRGREAWAVLDGHDGDALLALTKYKKGAVSLVERLEAYERRIVELTRILPRQPCGGNGSAPSSQP